MVGVSHQHASLELLEQVAVHVDETPRLLASLRSLGVGEAAVLSTCSRTELYVGPGIDSAGLLDVLTEHSGVDRSVLAPATRSLAGPAVAARLIRVTAGLESPARALSGRLPSALSARRAGRRIESGPTYSSVRLHIKGLRPHRPEDAGKQGDEESRGLAATCSRSSREACWCDTPTISS